jgi:PKD repeat protein
MKQRLRFFNVVLAGFCLLSLLHSAPVFAQKENNVWYFGNGAGIDFNSGSPVALTNGAIFTTEGCASIADTSGNLLFYTDGITVFNKVHNNMPNGVGLFGGNSSSQSAIIVPLPGSTTQYYIFTTPDQGSLSGLNYSIVDMTQQGGLGDVISLNNLLHSPIGEKVSATRHANGTDYWIVAHEFNTNAFYAFQFSAAGVNPVPVVSSVGLVHLGYHGYMKFTPNAAKIGLAVGETNDLELFDFNNSTGVVSNPITFPNTYLYPYGVEFSPDNSKFYIAQSGVGGAPGIYQFDMLAGSPAAIIASGQLVGTTTNTYLGPLQAAPDGKIYCARYLTGFVGVIDNPNVLGAACNYIDMAVNLNAGVSMFGLPNMIPAFNSTPVAIFSSPNHICPGTCTDFTNLSINANTFQWTFSGATPGVSSDANPTNVCYNTPGQYDVMLIASNATGADTLLLPNYITVYAYPPAQGIQQSGDTLIANIGFTSYQWYFNGFIIPGATGYYYVAQASGDYNVVCTDENNCEVEAVIFSVIASAHTAAENGSRPAFNIFPNPVYETLSVATDELTGTAAEISIYNVLGEKLFSPVPEIRNGALTIDCGSLAEGIYSLELFSGSKSFRIHFAKR